jgi:hypothetical protein
MPIRDFDAVSSIVGQNIRDELSSSASSAVASIGAPHAHAATDAVKSLSKRDGGGEELASRRLHMLSNGYVPLPASDKGVYLPNWSKLDENGNQCGVDPTVHEIACWSLEHPDWQSTSVRCGEVVASDCDILDKAVSDKVREEARRCFGKAFPTRVGNPPKFLMMCRTPEPFSKLRTGKYLQPDGDTSQVEVLCRGQQFIAFGIHPKTGKHYEWFGGDPLTVAVADLPEVSRDKVVEFLRTAEGILSSQPGWTLAPKAARANYEDHKHDEPKQDYSGKFTDWVKLEGALDELTDVEDTYIHRRAEGRHRRSQARVCLGVPLGRWISAIFRCCWSAKDLAKL